MHRLRILSKKPSPEVARRVREVALTFLKHADLLPSKMKVGETIHNDDKKIKKVEVLFIAPDNKSMELFCAIGDYTRHGAQVTVHFAHRIPLNAAEIDHAASEFNVVEEVTTAASRRSTSRERYINGGQAKRMIPQLVFAGK
jgi:hypothetical protein